MPAPPFMYCDQYEAAHIKAILRNLSRDSKPFFHFRFGNLGADVGIWEPAAQVAACGLRQSDVIITQAIKVIVRS